MSKSLSSQRLIDVRNQINETTNIMKNNMDKILDRDEQLETLEFKAEKLKIGSQRFEKKARVLKRTMWWKNIKFWIILFIVLLIIISIIVIIIYTTLKKH